MAKESGGFVKSKAKGIVNYPPFENLDEGSLQEIKRYQVYPYGKIQEYCRHIPYNSGKKDFFEKTGRESFEGLEAYGRHAVFQYIFKVPGDDSEYTVMWDYNVGLVRMTPFFKCCKYSKTMPAKMLNMNPGLRDITHSITGGSIMAQGYWMPHACAKAVCATFCAPIAGALIPIFGPDFPSQCIAPDAPEHGRMAIDPAIVAESGREAELYRRVFANVNAVNVNGHLPLHPHHHPTNLPEDFLYHGGPDPLLSAIPRFSHAGRLDHYQTSQRLPPIPRTSAAWTTSKRPAPEAEAGPEFGLDGQSESSPATTVTTATSRALGGQDRNRNRNRNREEDEFSSVPNRAVATYGAEKNAALLLMNLSVKDHRGVRCHDEREDGGRFPGGDRASRGCGQESMSMSPMPATADGHRSKRRRATSM
ncbi:putative apses transcription factor xbp1 [Diaporthe ampelina]|uniref:Putative apses transcription factor xbp1 n=1 Tax=Diaporthe ampelina TaxID=1214573 RepID=A0A0G2HLB2_9PEZI|nr:putative apses transcription factor xbp1 [Diaporthe ampelina]